MHNTHALWNKLINAKLFRSRKTPLQTACLIIFSIRVTVLSAWSIQSRPASHRVPSAPSPSLQRPGAGSMYNWTWVFWFVLWKVWKMQKVTSKEEAGGLYFENTGCIDFISTLKRVLLGKELNVLPCSFTLPSSGCSKWLQNKIRKTWSSLKISSKIFRFEWNRT